MIVDNAPAVYQRLVNMLGGVEALVGLSIARSLREVKEKCCAFNPDTIVLDVQLPDGLGLDAMQKIRACCKEAHVFVFSNRTEYREKAMQAGVDDFFDKSLDFELLIERLKQLNQRNANASVERC